MMLFLTSCTSNSANASNSLELNSDSRYANTYPVSEFLDDDTYNKYMNDDGSIFNCITKFCDSLTNAKQFSYVPFVGNEIELLNIDIPECCREMKDTYKINNQSAMAVKAIQISKSFTDLFPYKIDKGRDFIIEDYNYYISKTIPIILGSAYNDYFSVGDVFEGYYLFERFNFEVIGILDSDSTFYNKQVGGLDSYDNFIIMPLANVTEDNEFSRIVSLQKLSGFMLVNGNRQEALEEYYNLLDLADLKYLSNQFTINSKPIMKQD